MFKAVSARVRTRVKADLDAGMSVGACAAKHKVSDASIYTWFPRNGPKRRNKIDTANAALQAASSRVKGEQWMVTWGVSSRAVCANREAALAVALQKTLNGVTKLTVWRSMPFKLKAVVEE